MTRKLDARRFTTPARWLTLALGALAAMSCAAPSNYECNDNGGCVYKGEQGMCEATGYCSFPDTACSASHRRYGDLAPSDIAGTCLPAAPGGNCVAQLSMGAEFSCALKTDGTVWCWGSNEYKQISNDPNAPGKVTTPTEIKGTPKDVKELSAGEDHICLLTKSGQVWCWGSNANGQLGVTKNGDPTQPIDSTATPTQVTGLPPVQDMSAGGKHSCAVVGGTAYCWGANGYYQLGDGTKTSSPVPVQVIGISNVAEIDTGDEHTCATTTDGPMYCWGANSDGQCGAGKSVADCTKPTQVTKLTGAERITAGDEHTCAQRSDETIWCWGYNQSGGVGVGTTQDVYVPTKIITGPAMITGSTSFHTCAIVEHNSNELWCWGENDDGEIGGGSMAKAVLSPERVELTGATEVVATGGKHTCAVTADGQLWCWGNNDFGQLGIGGKPGGVFRDPMAVTSLCK